MPSFRPVCLEEVILWIQDELRSIPTIMIGTEAKRACALIALDGEEGHSVCVATNHQRKGIGTLPLCKAM